MNIFENSGLGPAEGHEINQIAKNGIFCRFNIFYNHIKTFLSSPIACVACERLELLKTEIRVVVDVVVVGVIFGSLGS